MHTNTRSRGCRVKREITRNSFFFRLRKLFCKGTFGRILKSEHPVKIVQKVLKWKVEGGVKKKLLLQNQSSILKQKS